MTTRRQPLARLARNLFWVAALSACTALPTNDSASGRWIRWDGSTQRFSINASQVPRGQLLDELKSLTRSEVRPQPERDEKVSVVADQLDLDMLLVLLLPPGTRATVRPGGNDVPAVPKEADEKKGPPSTSAVGRVPKPDALSQQPMSLQVGSVVKTAAELPYAVREVSGPGTKPPTEFLLRTAQNVDPKKPLHTRIELATVRLTLLFEDGSPPRLLRSQTLEGQAPAQRFATGPYLFALIAADGKLLQTGTFQDPLLEHSYLPEGPHSVGRSKSGVVGISLARQHLAGARLMVVDTTTTPLPRELTDEAVRAALERQRPALVIDTQTILRSLDQETQK
jgi:hypothetical protein